MQARCGEHSAEGGAEDESLYPHRMSFLYAGATSYRGNRFVSDFDCRGTAPAALSAACAGGATTKATAVVSRAGMASDGPAQRQRKWKRSWQRHRDESAEGSPTVAIWHLVDRA
jgi:hypothetical protein